MNSDTTASDRPAETELLLNQDVAPDAEVDAATAETELPGVGFGDFVRVVLVLIFVIGLIYAFVWFLKRFTSQKAESEGVINLLSTRPLKGDTALHLVEVGNQVFLIGSCSNSVNLISEIDDPESIDAVKLATSQSPAAAKGGFARMLRDRLNAGTGFPRVLGNGTESGKIVSSENSATVHTGDANSDPASFLRSQKERLKDL